MIPDDMKDRWADAEIIGDFTEEQRDAYLSAVRANNVRLTDWLVQEKATQYAAAMILAKYDQMELEWLVNELVLRVPADDRFNLLLNCEVKRAEATDRSIALATEAKKQARDDGWGES